MEALDRRSGEGDLSYSSGYREECEGYYRLSPLARLRSQPDVGRSGWTPKSPRGQSLET